MGSPALSVAHRKYGRLYRWPGSDLPVEMRPAQMNEALREGMLVPSVTNVIGVRSKDYLQGWYSRHAAKAALEIFARYPDTVRERPVDAKKWIADAGTRDLNSASERGTRVHDACESLARGLSLPDDLNEDELGCVASWRAFLAAWKPEWLHLEATCFGEVDGHRYAGTGDFFAQINGLSVIGDYKTNRGGLHTEVGSQLAALAHANRIVLTDGTLAPMPYIEAGIGLHLSADGYQVAPVDLDGSFWDVFRHCLSIWEDHVTGGDGSIRLERKAMGRPLRGPDVLLRSPGRPAFQASSVSAPQDRPGTDPLAPVLLPGPFG